MRSERPFVFCSLRNAHAGDCSRAQLNEELCCSRLCLRINLTAWPPFKKPESSSSFNINESEAKEQGLGPVQ